MPNIDLLLDNIAQVVKSDKSKQTLFSIFDLRYAYSEILLDKATREQGNFSLIGSNYAYLDDILIVTKGSIELHRQKLLAF